MKRVRVILFVVSLTLLSGCAEKIPEEITEDKDKTANWKAYNNGKYGYEIKYPSDWEGEGDTRIDSATFHAPRYTSGYDLYINCIYVKVYDNRKVSSVDSWLRENKGAAQVIDYEEKEPITVGKGISGLKLYTVTGPMSYMSVFVAKGKFAYEIKIPEGSENMQVFELMLSTFKF